MFLTVGSMDRLCHGQLESSAPLLFLHPCTHCAALAAPQEILTPRRLCAAALRRVPKLGGPSGPLEKQEKMVTQMAALYALSLPPQPPHHWRYPLGAVPPARCYHCADQGFLGGNI